MGWLSILLIEDEERVRQEIRRILAQHTEIALVSEAETGEDGILKVEAWEPNVVVVDDTLPDMNSFHLVAQVRKRVPKTQALILASNGSFLADALASGASAVLNKAALEDLPLTLQEITTERWGLDETSVFSEPKASQPIAAESEQAKPEEKTAEAQAAPTVPATPEVPESKEVSFAIPRQANRLLYLALGGFVASLTTNLVLIGFIIQGAGWRAWLRWIEGMHLELGLGMLGGIALLVGIGVLSFFLVRSRVGFRHTLFQRMRIARGLLRVAARAMRKGHIEELPPGYAPDYVGVVLVEPQESMLKGLANLVKSYQNFQVLGTASNGRQALEVIDLTRPSVIVMAANLPGLDGVEVTRIIKRKYPGMKVILSASDSAQRAQAISAGATSYILRDTLLRDLAGTIGSATKKSLVKSEQGAKLPEREISLAPQSIPTEGPREPRKIEEAASATSLVDTYLVVSKVGSFSTVTSLKDAVEHIAGVSEVVVQGVQEGTLRLKVRHAKGTPLTDSLLNLPQFSFQLLSAGPGPLRVELEAHSPEAKASLGMA